MLQRRQVIALACRLVSVSVRRVEFPAGPQPGEVVEDVLPARLGVGPGQRQVLLVDYLHGDVTSSIGRYLLDRVGAGMPREQDRVRMQRRRRAGQDDLTVHAKLPRRLALGDGTG